MLDIQISLCSCVTQIVQSRSAGYSAVGIVFRNKLPGLIDTLQLPTFCKSAGVKKIPDSQIDRVVLYAEYLQIVTHSFQNRALLTSFRQSTGFRIESLYELHASALPVHAPYTALVSQYAGDSSS